MNIKNNYDLKELNTFGISAKTKFFVEISKESDFKELLNTSEFKENEKLFLGEGSNVLFVKDFDGIVILNKLKGIKILKEENDFVLLQAMGGEKWNDLVNFSVAHNYWGIENLALIPGTVGAAPIQNIGAYGVEIKDSLLYLEAFDLATGEKKIFKNRDCKFGYRDSIFKNSLKGKYFISSIVLQLSKKEKKNVSYKILREYIEKNQVKINKPKDISDVVTIIRKSKLPNPKLLGNAGSFFKNISLEKKEFEELLKKYPKMPYFDNGEKIKIPTAWLIEQCGWKGRRIGNVGVHEKQALVIVNYGGAKGLEVQTLATKIINSVFDKFELKITTEVNFIS